VEPPKGLLKGSGARKCHTKTEVLYFFKPCIGMFLHFEVKISTFIIMIIIKKNLFEIKKIEYETIFMKRSAVSSFIDFYYNYN